MKKILFSVLFACMMVICVQAQVFVGGSFGFDYSEYKESSGSTTYKGPAVFAFEFSPMVGFYLTDNFAIGTKINLGVFGMNDREDKPTKDQATLIGFSPFIRNNLVSVGNLSLLLETSVGVNAISSKSTYESVSVDGPSALIVGISAVPILSYNFTDRLSIEMHTNILRLGLGTSVVKEKFGSTEYKDTNTYFGFGVNPSGLSSTIMNEFDILINETPFQIGMVFKF